MLKTVVLLNIFMETFNKCADEQHLFEIKNFCNMTSFFTVTLNDFNVSLLNPYAALGTFLVFCSLISLTILAVLMQMV